ncbi:hypothetical protein EKO27_g9647 [Xylaria grammica]|uniref:Uncharacterized protein n=1 Tax=Xylaria grammica TaxID=363999 RepID=A0A439CTG8_9PEZI|nr:hypothetical protein EKO27_g9647 [Xylaria grammica]
MLIRRLWTRGAPSRSAINLSQQTCGKTQGLHKGANLRLALQKHGLQQRVSRAYSNYAPRGPPPYYNTYSQPPKSRASRLKDMAIGSILTIAVFLGVDYWCVWGEEEMEEEVEEGNGIGDEIYIIFTHYNRLLEGAEASDDGSLESAEKIKNLFRERAIALIHATSSKKDLEDSSIKDLGQLPRLPEGRECNEYDGVQKIKDEDTLIFLLPQSAVSEMRKKTAADLRRGSTSRSPVPVHNIVIAINAFTGSPMTGGFTRRPNDAGTFPVPELMCRTAFMLENLHKEGVLTGPPTTIVTVFLRDQIGSFICVEEDSDWGKKPGNRVHGP